MTKKNLLEKMTSRTSEQSGKSAEEILESFFLDCGEEKKLL